MNFEVSDVNYGLWSFLCEELLSFCYCAAANDGRGFFASAAGQHPRSLYLAMLQGTSRVALE